MNSQLSQDSEIFAAALKLPDGEERDAYLAKACAVDADFASAWRRC